MNAKIKNLLLKRTHCFYLAVLYGILLQSCLAQETEEALAHTTELVFYSTSTSGWSSNGNTEKLQAELVAQANTFCQTVPESCGLLAMNDGLFQNSDVVVIDGFPADDTRNMKIKFYMKLPGDVTLAVDSTTQILLMKNALNAISLGARDKVHAATGSYIIFIEETHYGPPLTTLANNIIIPLAFAVLLGLIIAAISLNFYVKHREKQEKHLKQIEMRKKKTHKVAPAYPSRNDNTTTSTILSNEQMGHHHEFLDKNPNPPTEPYIAQPLERSDEQGTLVLDDEKRDRRRRHKKSRRHRHHDNGVENPVIEEGKTLDDLLQKHREKQEKHLKQIEMRKKKTHKVAPAYPSRNDNTTTSTILSNEQMGYHHEFLDKNPNPPTEPYIAQPLERSDEQGTLVLDDEKRDRRRRHKKSRRHRHHDNGVENPVIEDGKTLDDLLQ